MNFAVFIRRISINSWLLNFTRKICILILSTVIVRATRYMLEESLTLLLHKFGILYDNESTTAARETLFPVQV